MTQAFFLALNSHVLRFCDLFQTILIMNSDQLPASRGNQLSVLLLIGPLFCLLFAWFGKENFIMPVDTAGFLLDLGLVSGISFILVFALSFWKAEKALVLIPLFFFLGVLWIAGGLAILPILNVQFDKSKETVYKRAVLQSKKNTGSWFRGTRSPDSCVAQVAPWGEFTDNTWLEVNCGLIKSMESNKTNIRFSIHQGLLNYTWVSALEVVE